MCFAKLQQHFRREQGAGSSYKVRVSLTQNITALLFNYKSLLK